MTWLESVSRDGIVLVQIVCLVVVFFAFASIVLLKSAGLRRWCVRRIRELYGQRYECELHEELWDLRNRVAQLESQVDQLLAETHRSKGADVAASG